MSLVVIIWSMIAACCLTLSGLHFLVWVRARDSWDSAFFSIAAFAAATTTLLELNLVYSQTPAEYGAWLQWMHLPAGVLVISVVWFIRVHMKAGRVWLAWTTSVLRTLVIAFNFLVTPNLTFQKITGLQTIEFLGDKLAIPVGVMNPGRYLIQLSMVAFLVFVVDAAISDWKKGNKERSIVVGGSIALAIGIGPIFSGLMVAGILPGPLIGFSFLLIVIGMAIELSLDVVRTRQLGIALRDTRRRIDLAAEVARLSFWEWDISRDRIWSTDADFERHFAASSQDLDFKFFLNSVHTVDRESTRQALELAVEENSEFLAEYRITDSSGETYWFALSGQVEHNEKEETVMMRGVSMDITRRKLAETEVQELHNQMTHFQRISTIGQLSTSLAHEINQPLGAILRNAEAGELFLKQDLPDLEELEAILTDIQQDAQRASSVIDGMRTFLKSRERRFELLVVRELVRDVILMLKPEAQARQVRLKTIVPTTFLQVRGDRIQLQQVVLNLLMNSFEALEGRSDGQNEVTIRVSETSEARVMLEIADQSGGIPTEFMPRLFDSFFTTKSTGIGVGLAISKEIVEHHDGEISVKNNEDGGATFRITLPRADSNEQG